MPYKFADKKKRNEELVAFASKHPDLSWREIGAYYGISGARAWLINKRWKEK